MRQVSEDDLSLSDATSNSSEEGWAGPEAGDLEEDAAAEDIRAREEELQAILSSSHRILLLFSICLLYSASQRF